jgi:hypothetical protein
MSIAPGRVWSIGSWAVRKLALRCERLQTIACQPEHPWLRLVGFTRGIESLMQPINSRFRPHAASKVRAGRTPCCGAVPWSLGPIELAFAQLIDRQFLSSDL